MGQYVVTGARTFQGQEPGTVFEVDFTEAEEARYKARGSIADATGETRGTTDLSALTRDDLNTVAAEAGVENPTSFSSKGDLIAAIEDKKSAGESGGDEGSN